MWGGGGECPTVPDFPFLEFSIPAPELNLCQLTLYNILAPVCLRKGLFSTKGSFLKKT